MLVCLQRDVPSVRSSTHHGRRPRKDYPRDDGFRSGVSFSATFGIAKNHCTATTIVKKARPANSDDLSMVVGDCKEEEAEKRLAKK